MQKYKSGDTAQQIGKDYDISKARAATVRREQGIIFCRQGLTDG